MTRLKIHVCPKALGIFFSLFFITVVDFFPAFDRVVN